MQKRKLKQPQEHQNTDVYTSPTSYILRNLNSLSFLDFCSTFAHCLKEKEEARRLLAKTLDIIKNAKSNKQEDRDKAEKLLNTIEELTQDDRVTTYFNVKKMKVAAKDKATAEYVFTQSVGSGMFSLSAKNGSADRERSPDSESDYAENSSTVDEQDSDYISRVSTASSNATQEGSIAPATITKYDYLVSSNEKDFIDVAAIDKKWILRGGFDYSAAFLNKRNQLVKGSCTNVERLTQEEELAINGIVLLDDDLHSTMVDEEVYEQACDEMGQRYRQYEEQEEAHSQPIVRFAELMSKGKFSEAEGAINEVVMPGHIRATLYSLKRTYGKGYQTDATNEATVVKDGIQPFLDNLFPNCKNYTTYGSDREIAESSKRFADIDPSLQDHVRKADFSIVSNRAGHLILTVEAKSEHSRRKSKADLPKMARYMKDTIDCIREEGFGQVSLAGLIVSSGCCSVYIMTQEHDYLYTLYRLGRFYMPLNHHDMYRICSIFPTLEHLKNILEPTFRELSKLKDVNRPDTLATWKHLKTYHTPIKTQESRVKKVDLTSPKAKLAARKLKF